MSHFSEFCPQHTAVTLEADWYTRHGFGSKTGPAIASLFEIKAAVQTPDTIMVSKKDPKTRIFVRPVGTYHNKGYVTLVLAKESGADMAFVSTAYNAETYLSKGDVIWTKTNTPTTP